MARKQKNEAKKKIIQSENVKIEIRPYSGNNLLGFATVTLYDEITIYNCKIVEGKKTNFLSMPSYKGSDDNYYNYVYIDKDSDLAAEINELVASWDPSDE